LAHGVRARPGRGGGGPGGGRGGGRETLVELGLEHLPDAEGLVGQRWRRQRRPLRGVRMRMGGWAGVGGCVILMSICGVCGGRGP